MLTLKPDTWLHRFAIIWLITVLIILMGAWRKGFVFDSSILSLLPESQQDATVQLATDKLAEEFSQRLFVLIGADNEEVARSTVKEAAITLEQIEGVGELTWKITSAEYSQFDNNYFPYRFAILADEVRQALLESDNRLITDKALQKIYSPIGIAGGSLVEDPFRLFSELKLTREQALNVSVDNGLLRLSGAEQPTYLLIAMLESSPFELVLQQQVQQVLSDFESNPDVSVEAAGMLLHATAGTSQARGEIQTIGFGSLLGVMVLILVVFRGWRPLLLMLMPVCVGCVVAASITTLIFTKVHLVTFAFGAGLVGVAVDYALHFLCERKPDVNARSSLYKLLPGLALGLISSVLAYAVQTLTPFPGLQQMATFSITGLVAAWLTVVLWLPLLTEKYASQPAAASIKLTEWRQRFPRLEGKARFVVILLLLLPVVFVFSREGVDDVRLLQTSPPELLANEKRIQEMLGSTSSSQFLLIKGKSIEQNLQLEEDLQPVLDRLIATGDLKGYQGLAESIPSEERQRDNLRLVTGLYASALDEHLQRLGLPETLSATLKNEFIADEQQVLSFDGWSALPGNRHWTSLLIQQEQGQVVTTIRLQGLSPAGLISLDNHSQQESNLVFVDRVADISALLGNYRGQVSYWLAIAYLGILLLLTIRYRMRVLRIVLPPLVASGLTMAALIGIEGGVNLFHLLALVLVLGIGLDMGIFLTETDGDPYTWLAVSLSSLTSLLAFGLLSLSNTPVLHHFGLTVLIGLTLVWLLAVLLRTAPEQ